MHYPGKTAALMAAMALLGGHAASAQETATLPFAADGSLDRGDRRTAEGSRYDTHTLRLTAGQRVRISARSDAFDTVVRLYRSGEDEPVAENDDGEGSLNSRLVFVADRDGEYTLRVASFAEDGAGAYSVSAEAMPPLPDPIPALGSITTTTWRTIAGTLTADDAENGGNRFDDYLISLDEGQEVLLRLDGDGFDPMVQVFPASRRDGDPIASDDDGAGDLNSFLLFKAGERGDFIVRVTSVGTSGGGNYRLRIGE